MAVLCLVACGRPVISTCHQGPFEVDGEVELDCLAVSRSVSLVRALYSSGSPRDVLPLEPAAGYSFEDPWPTFSVDFDRAFTGTRVLVEDSDSVGCGGKSVGGCTQNGNVSVPGTQQISFGHELMHVYECRVGGNCNNVNHDGWDENGYKNFGVAYQWGVTDGGTFASTILPVYNWGVSN